MARRAWFSRAMMAAILEAGKWIDASLANKNKMAEVIANKSYVNTSKDAIDQRIMGRYQNGLGKTGAPMLAQTPNDPAQRERQLAEFEKIKAGF